jgi:hypothetical protein
LAIIDASAWQGVPRMRSDILQFVGKRIDRGEKQLMYLQHHLLLIVIHPG